jgi:cell division protein FtsW
LLTFLDPWADPQGAGFQSVQALIALGSGGLFGVGLGESVQKVYYLPEASTDMIFAIIGEELGLLGTSALIIAYILFGYCGCRIALACRDPFGKRLAAGITALICGQAAVNLCAVLGIAPLTGIPLPFVSYGGSSLIVSLAAVGILLNIALTDAGERRALLRDRSRGDGGTRAAGSRGGGGADRARRPRELRRAAST